MAFGFLNLPKAKWWAALRQVILKADFEDIETALLEAHGLIQVPNIAWVDATAIKVPATADCPAAVLMSGLPNILHPGAFVSGALSDGKYRVNVADTTMDFDVPASLWGTKKVSQWYAIFALAADADAVFTIKAMPLMRVCSDDEGTKVISLGTLITPATGRRYGFGTDELKDGKVYVLSGASIGLIRTITANNNATGVDGTSGTITYSGAALTLTEGDWFIVLPPGTNFRWLGDIYNDSSGNIISCGNLFFAKTGYLLYTVSGTFLCPLGVERVRITYAGGGGGGSPNACGGGGGMVVCSVVPKAGVSYVVNVGEGGGGNNMGSGYYGVVSNVVGLTPADAPRGGPGLGTGEGGTAGNGSASPGSSSPDPAIPGRSAAAAYGNFSIGGAFEAAGSPGFVLIEW